MAESVRLQKVLASCGIASRRRSEELIVAGRVRVDGRVITELGTRVDPRRQRVEVDGKRVTHDVLIYIVLHKPRGVMSTLSDPEKRPTVLDLVRDLGIRVAPVGRLDFNTSGVLLLTNDGDFASGLSHPRAGVPKDYLVKVRGDVDEACLERLGTSIEIDGTRTVPAQVVVARREGDRTWLRFTLREGKNRQVRRLVEYAGLALMRLSRIGYAGIGVDDLPMGRWRVLSVDELKALKRDFGVPKRVRAGERAYQSGVPISGGSGKPKPQGARERGGRGAKQSAASRTSSRARPGAAASSSSGGSERGRPAPGKTSGSIRVGSKKTRGGRDAAVAGPKAGSRSTGRRSSGGPDGGRSKKQTTKKSRR